MDNNHVNQQKTEQQKQADESEERLRSTLSRIKQTIVVMSGKGGVGKSTVAANLATALAMKGFQVGLLDVDIHGPNIPKMLGIEDKQLIGSEEGIMPVIAHPNLKVVSMAYLLMEKDVAVIWRGPMKIGAIRQFLSDVVWGDLDHLIIDLPPGTGDEPLSIAQQIPDAHTIIVTTPQDVALMDSRRSVNFARQLGLNVLGIVENMSGLECPHCGENIDLFKHGGGELAAMELDVPFLGKLPLEPEIVISGDAGKPFVMAHPDSISSLAMDAIVKKITSTDEANVTTDVNAQ